MFKDALNFCINACFGIRNIFVWKTQWLTEGDRSQIDCTSDRCSAAAALKVELDL